MSPANRCPPSSPAAFWHHSAVLPAPYSFLLPRPVGQQGLLANDAYVLPLRHWPGLARAPSPGRSWPCCCCFPPAAPWPWEVGRGPGRPCPQLPGWEAGSARPAWSCLPRQSHPVPLPSCPLGAGLTGLSALPPLRAVYAAQGGLLGEAVPVPHSSASFPAAGLVSTCGFRLRRLRVVVRSSTAGTLSVFSHCPEHQRGAGAQARLPWEGAGGRRSPGPVRRAPSLSGRHLRRFVLLLRFKIGIGIL